MRSFRLMTSPKRNLQWMCKESVHNRAMKKKGNKMGDRGSGDIRLQTRPKKSGVWDKAVNKILRTVDFGEATDMPA